MQLRRIRAPLLLVMAWSLAASTAAPAPADEPPAPPFHDPVARLCESSDDVGRSVVSAFATYDAAAIRAALAVLEGRIGKGDASDADRLLAALGYLELAMIARYYERNAPDALPAALQGEDGVALAARGLVYTEAAIERDPLDAEAHRIRGELLSYQITGMASAMTKGPEAREALERALEIDPRNGWTHFALARMYFHNPAFAGGDKERALALFRDLEPHLSGFRADLYLARCYHAKGMLAQSRYWAEKAARRAPGNPEIEALRAELRAAEARP